VLTEAAMVSATLQSAVTALASAKKSFLKHNNQLVVTTAATVTRLQKNSGN